MKSEHQRRVEIFMKLFGKPVPEIPTLPDYEIRKHCARLIVEEAAKETINALGFKLTTAGLHIILEDDPDWKRLERLGTQATLLEIIDGILDSIYVLTYCLSSCGIQDVEMQREVDENNILKAKGGAIICPETQKIIKPKDHPKPDLVKYLCGFRWV